MKKFFIYAFMAMLAIANTGCKKMLEKAVENATSSMMGSYLEELRQYPYSIEQCDSVMKVHGFEADKLKDMGITTWKREGCGEITRYKTQGEVIAIDLTAKSKFDVYSKAAARMWLQSMEKIMHNYSETFSATYDEKKLETFQAVYDKMDQEPAMLIRVDATNQRTDATYTIMAGSNPKSFTYTLIVKDFNIPVLKK